MKPSLSRLSLLMLAVLACTACTDNKKNGNAANTVPHVSVMTPVTSRVTDSIQLDGTVAPSQSANLVARVNGYLRAAPFTEGAEVKKDQLLFSIEPDTYQQQVKLYQAQVVQAKAEAERQHLLLEQNATAKSSEETAQSQLQQAEASLRLAQINLGYTEVRAPFTGVIGKRAFDVGNYVGATPGGTVLATLQQVRPAYVNFSVNERDLLRLRQRSATAQHPKPDMGKIKVMAALQGESQPSEVGTLDFIDNTLSQDTGSLALRATFTNKDLHLLPGMYAKVYIYVGAPRNALLIPNDAILSDQQGSYVYLVGSDGLVQRRNVQTGTSLGRLREVSSGLAASDRVVVEGLSNVGVGQQAVAELKPAPAVPSQQ